MKKKLLFLAFVLLTTLQGFAQAEAYPASNINQCGSEVFNLTVQTPIILGNQDPLNFTVTYYTTQADAANGTNPIANPSTFVSPQQQTIFAKVTNNANGDSDITVFQLSWVSGVFVPDMPDVFVCNSYTLPVIEVGHYYELPNGEGQIPFGTVINQTQVIYVYKENDFGCSDESSFLVNVFATVVNEPATIYACDEDEDGTATFDLTTAEAQLSMGQTNISFSYFMSQADAQANVNPIANPTAYTNVIPEQEIIWVRGSSTGTDCFWIVTLPIQTTECTGNTISGFVSLNLAGDCDSFEAAASNIPVYLTHNNDVYIAYTNADGYYHFDNVPDGATTVYIPSSPLNTVSPSTYAITMPGTANEKNFCITPQVNTISDVAVNIIPITQARSGFQATYAVIYQNLGTVTQNGTISLQFDTNHLVFNSGIPAMAQSGNTVTLDYTNLMAFQTKVALVYFTVNVPQITPQNTVLNFTVNITPVTGDINPLNNTSVMSQIVVNSWDPNDISVREGKTITEAQADDYLHYTVRFQNKGTANAENVRIVVDLDANLDWSTFEPLSGSDAFTVKRTEDEIEFMFTGIDLAFENTNTGTVPESNGHVIYRVKPKASVTLGDIMKAQAHIYFDFNDPIDTETIETKVQNVAGVNENSLESFTVHPNPASANVNLMVANADNGFNVSVIDMLGKTVIKSSFSTNEVSLDISALNSGIYFINIVADGKSQIKKLIVK